MIRLELDVADLADVRFAISPLHEAIGSLWPVYGQRGRPEHRGWGRHVRAQPGMDHELLASMVSPRRWIPDFIAPPPTTARPRLRVLADAGLVNATRTGRSVFYQQTDIGAQLTRESAASALPC